MMSATSNDAVVKPCLAASALANVIAVGDASSPTVLWPNAAKCSDSAASPQPASSTSPLILPWSISAAISGCGSPRLHGGRAPANSAASPR